jgi:hypothetical protein
MVKPSRTVKIKGDVVEFDTDANKDYSLTPLQKKVEKIAAVLSKA